MHDNIFINTEILNGNLISPNWYKNILKKDGNAHLSAINLYSYIVDWYKLTYNKALARFEKKFKSDLLQLSYKNIKDNLNISKSCAEDALKFLVEGRFVQTELRTITIGDKKYNNVRFVKLNLDKYEQITKPILNVDNVSSKRSEGKKEETPYLLKEETNTTKTSPLKNTTTNNQKEKLSTDGLVVVEENLVNDDSNKKISTTPKITYIPSQQNSTYSVTKQYNNAFTITDLPKDNEPTDITAASISPFTIISKIRNSASYAKDLLIKYGFGDLQIYDKIGQLEVSVEQVENNLRYCQLRKQKIKGEGYILTAIRRNYVSTNKTFITNAHIQENTTAKDLVTLSQEQQSFISKLTKLKVSKEKAESIVTSGKSIFYLEANISKCIAIFNKTQDIKNHDAFAEHLIQSNCADYIEMTAEQQQKKAREDEKIKLQGKFFDLSGSAQRKLICQVATDQGITLNSANIFVHWQNSEFKKACWKYFVNNSSQFVS